MHDREEYYRNLAKAGKLRYVHDAIKGITRKGVGKGFAYYLPDGALLRCTKEKRRINALAIPPAYQDVWICPYVNGHLQATWRDDRGRKQYRYHPDWEAIRDATKFEQVSHFCAALPAIRQRLAKDLRQHGLTRTRVLAAMVLMMHHHYIRVGNDIYAKQHGTYGLTTLRKKHSRTYKDTVALEFKGKNSKDWHIDLHDKRLIKVIRQCEELPGYELFRYVDDEGNRHTIDSQDVNDYLREISGQPLTAKDFRTWAACRECFERLCEITPETSKRQQAMQYNAIVKEVASLMGHTVAVCKKSYLHPTLFSHWASGELHAWVHKHNHDDMETAFHDWWQEVALQSV